MNDNAKIIFIGDHACREAYKWTNNEDLKKRFQKEDMTRDELMNLMQEFRGVI